MVEPWDKIQLFFAFGSNELNNVKIYKLTKSVEGINDVCIATLKT